MNEITKITKNLGGLISKNSPHILTGLGCAGLVSTAILTGKATPKALMIIEEETNYRERKRMDALSKMDKVKLTWKCYIPAGVVGITSIGCIIGANTVNMKRNAALASLYALSESAFREYKTKVVQEIGKPKETKIQDEIAKDRIANNPPPRDTTTIVGDGDVLCYDYQSGRYFRSSYEKIRQAANDLNYDLKTEMWIDLNDFYERLGLPPIPLGNLMGFDIDKGYLEPFYSTQLDPNGNPCLALGMDVYPKHY